MDNEQQFVIGVNGRKVGVVSAAVKDANVAAVKAGTGVVEFTAPDNKGNPIEFFIPVSKVESVSFGVKVQKPAPVVLGEETSEAEDSPAESEA